MDCSLKRLSAQNERLAKKLWKDNLRQGSIGSIKCLTEEFEFSIARGDLLLLNGSLYVTHSGLLGVAKREGCVGIRTSILKNLSCPEREKYAFRALVRKSSECRGFVGFGDADPSNVSPQMHGSEMRIAETRAVNRALRKAYGIGLCSLEELGVSSPAEPPRPSNQTNIVGNIPPPLLRDQISLVIRKYKLDSELVKRYAADFCGTEVLRNASRELIEDFLQELSGRAENDLPGLQCLLQDYSGAEKVAS